MVDPQFWHGRRVFVTGHTGFKGAWLCAWLDRLGADVTAFALPPSTAPALIKVIAPWMRQTHIIGDIRDATALATALQDADPEIVFHLAAQALVRESYADPTGTFGTNLMGTVNLLEACRSLSTLKAVLVVTSDKVYANDDSGTAFCEQAPLGGKDPYSSSKACTELATAAYRTSFFRNGASIATARAGNVIGGGDWAPDRVIPDVIRALDLQHPVRLRNPASVRPWQHVLDPLSGYLLFAQRLVQGTADIPNALNFGPCSSDTRTVAQIVDAISTHFGGKPGRITDDGEHPPEASLLSLSSKLAERSLGWKQRLMIDEALEWTAAWYAAHRAGRDMREFTLAQISSYMGRLA